MTILIWVIMPIIISVLSFLWGYTKGRIDEQEFNDMVERNLSLKPEFIKERK